MLLDKYPYNEKIVMAYCTSYYEYHFNISNDSLENCLLNRCEIWSKKYNDNFEIAEIYAKMLLIKIRDCIRSNDNITELKNIHKKLRELQQQFSDNGDINFVCQVGLKMQ